MIIVHFFAVPFVTLIIYSSVLNYRGYNKQGWVGSQHRLLKVGGGGMGGGVTIKWPSGQAIILLVKWVGGNCGGVQTLSIGQGVLLYKMIVCFFFCVYHCEGVFFHSEKYLYYYLDQEYCFDSCQFLKYCSCKISVGFRYFVRGWKLNKWVDVSYNFHNLGGHY